MEPLIQALYLLSAIGFIFSLRWMNDPKTARKGVAAGVGGMVLAVGGTMLHHEIKSYEWILVAMVLGTIAGVPLSRVALTAVPQRTALSHAFGGLAAGLVGTAKYFLWAGTRRDDALPHGRDHLRGDPRLPHLHRQPDGRGQAAGGPPHAPDHLQGPEPRQPGAAGRSRSASAAYLVYDPTRTFLFPVMIALALAFGVLLVIPIGGADMPTVISLLNSYAGLAAVAMGFVLENTVLIIAGALDGSSGLILSIIMCKAMNRSFTNVLFGAFGQVQAAAAAGEQKAVKSATAEDAAQILDNASTVVVVPGYGMAVAQAQHRVRDLFEHLNKKGIDVKFAIHPVAGRMPGHMNVLLAEAEIPYDRLIEMDDINPEMGQVDVCLVVGANDVVNPAARHDKSSPIFGMPIIDADKAKTVLAIKRSMKPGFAGIDNELYTADNTLMLFGDAKQVIGELAKAVSGEQGMGH